MTVTLKVDGMHCGGCARAVTGVLSRIDRVTSVDVDLAAGRVVIEADPGIDTAALVTAVEDAGYAATVS